MKALKIAAGIALAIGAAYLAKREYDKQRKAQTKRREEKKESLKKVGVEIETLEREVGNDEETNLVKSLYSGIAYNPEWDIDVIDVEAFMEGTPGLIHISQSKSNRGDNCLDVLFELPNYTKDSFNSPKIGDYIKSICGAVEDMNKTINVKPVSKKLVAIAAVTYNNGKFDDEDVTKFVELGPEVYKSYASGDRDGLSDFYEEVVNYGMRKECREMIMDMVGYTGEYENFRVNDLFLMYKVVYFANSINFESTLSAIKDVTDNLVVTRTGASKSVEYNHLVFHAVNEEGDFDMSYYYCLDSNNHVCSESFVY